MSRRGILNLEPLRATLDGDSAPARHASTDRIVAARALPSLSTRRDDVFGRNGCIHRGVRLPNQRHLVCAGRRHSDRRGSPQPGQAMDVGLAVDHVDPGRRHGTVLFATMESYLRPLKQSVSDYRNTMGSNATLQRKCLD
jgi:hypothetical protein